MYQGTEYWVRIRKIIRLYEGMLSRVARQYKLTSTETDIMSFLQHNPSKDTAMEIAEYRMLSKGCVSKAVESLIQKGLLERAQDRNDRRIIHLHMRSEAAPLLESIEQVQAAYWRQIFSGFSREEIARYMEYNNRILKNVQSAEREETDG